MKTVTPEEFDKIRRYLTHKRSKREGTEGFCFWINDDGRIMVELWLNENGEQYRLCCYLDPFGQSIKDRIERTKVDLRHGLGRRIQ